MNICDGAHSYLAESQEIFIPYKNICFIHVDVSSEH